MLVGATEPSEPVEQALVSPIQQLQFKSRSTGSVSQNLTPERSKTLETLPSATDLIEKEYLIIVTSPLNHTGLI